MGPVYCLSGAVRLGNSPYPGRSPVGSRPRAGSECPGKSRAHHRWFYAELVELPKTPFPFGLFGFGLVQLNPLEIALPLPIGNNFAVSLCLGVEEMYIVCDNFLAECGTRQVTVRETVDGLLEACRQQFLFGC